MSFLKRKELYAKCPAIRNQEERIGYKLNKLSISQRSTQSEIYVDNFKIEINDCPENKTKKSGITIQHLYLSMSPICILKCDEPIRVINLIMYLFSELPEDSGKSSWVKTTVPVKHLETKRVSQDDTMKAARSVLIPENGEIDGKILSEWQANKITINTPFPLEEVVTYCTGIAESGRPTGFYCVTFFKNANIDSRTIDWMAEMLNARETMWNGRKCFTIPLNNASELNVHGNLVNRSNRLIIEVNARGTAIDR
uniref:MATH domain-containing protein n=1 Tax=Caenorhabditis tropicalis TaxID=1561998 RepID=A0A1I7V122_9PELO